MRKIKDIPKSAKKDVQNDLDAIASKIKSARKSAAMTQEDLAEASGVSPTMIQSIEQGRRIPSVELLLTIFSILEIKIFR